MKIQGVYNEAVIFTKKVEQSAIDQIKDLCDREEYRESKIRIMPDVHAGSGCVIGTTMTINGCVDPNLVGVDVGCGVLVATLETPDLDLAKLDSAIQKAVPSGFTIRDYVSSFADQSLLDSLPSLKCVDSVSLDRAMKSLGTLGGGNHFIEVARKSYGQYALLIHTGSRKLGLEVCNHYQAMGCIKGEDFENYIHDMKIAQRYAKANREIILKEISNELGLGVGNSFHTVHNYIDTEKMLLRKGAVSAERGEILVIPLNMSDGTLLCVGNGTSDWNCSAPHGAGRVLSRGEARRKLSLDDFHESMKQVYSTCVGEATLDESPMAYKPAQEIIDAIGDTVEVLDILRPIYNFKAH